MKNHPSFASHIPKKNLGQNFLIDQNIQHKIIEACDLNPEDVILEIGPGKGNLTGLIAPRVKKLTAIEADGRLATALTQQFQGKNVTVIQADFLQYPLNEFPPQTKVIGNLPYYISTPIVEKILIERHRFSLFYLTVQWELGLRMTAKPNSKDYGSWSCFVQYYSQPEILFKIKNTAFKPTPKVQSCFLKLNLQHHPPLKARDEQLLFTMTQAAFGQRRKTIMNSLSSLIPKDKLIGIIEKLNLNPQARAENLSLNDFVRLTNEAGEGKN